LPIVNDVGTIDVPLPFEVLQVIVVAAGQSEYNCKPGFVNVVELNETVTLVEVATKEYQTSGLLPVPWPQGLVIAVYVAPVKVPDVLVQLLACVILMADAQLSLEGCANKIVGIQMNSTIGKNRIGDKHLIVWILACFKDWTIYFLLPVKIA
jgi:hypothetical protein